MGSGRDLSKYFVVTSSTVVCAVEAERVAQFEAGCLSGCSLSELGALMSQSHVSLRDLYECSHAQLDRLVDQAMAAGALGARLTGAGYINIFL